MSRETTFTKERMGKSPMAYQEAITLPGRSSGPGIGFPTRMVLMAILTLLAIQFLLGMVANLYTPVLPPSYAGLFAGSGPGSYPLIVVHVVVAYLLTLLAVLLIVLLRKRGTRLQAALSLLGLFGILVAGIGGYQFLNSGGKPIWSFVMASAFLWTFSMYFYLESKSRPSTLQPGQSSAQIAR